MESTSTSIRVYGDLDVYFPYTPYPSQIVYMDRMVASLSNQQSALLESPTGTGKTLCLLCACLAWLASPLSLETRKIWQKSNDSNTNIDIDYENSGSKESIKNSGTSSKILHPKVIYTSRTHSQLDQVMKELRKISGLYSFKSGILASRDHLCSNPDVVNQSSNAKTASCHRLVSKRQCQYYDKVSKAIQSSVLSDSSSVIDLEDLVSIGTEYNACPYYVARHQSEKADILLIPYNYLLDTQIRDAMNLNLEGTVIIFDEAHNLESVCCDVYSYDISISDMERLLSAFRNRDTMLKTFLVQIHESFKLIFSNMTQATCSKPGKFFLDEILKSINSIGNGINGNLDILLNIIDEIQSTLRLWTENEQSFINSISHVQPSSILNTIYNILRVLLPLEKSIDTNTDSILEYCYRTTTSYRVFLDAQVQKIGFWCFDAGLAMNELVRLGVSSIILTSGTLSPMSSLASELSIPFHIQLSNKHVLRDTKDQVCMSIVTHGNNNELLDGSFACRGASYDRSIKEIIEMAVQTIPNGLLVFFSSYNTMQSCIKILDMKHIQVHKQVFIESKDRDSFQTLLKRYQSAASREGAVLFAIARGKVAEGIDFSDEKARGIIMVGLPFPALLDPKIELKRDYLDGKKQLESLSGSEWYLHQAIRAVNQAIGRVIRHRDDYGTIILCDHRYSRQEVKQNLPSWAKETIQIIPNSRDLEKHLDLFFRKKGNYNENASTKKKRLDNPDRIVTIDKCNIWFQMAKKKLDAKYMLLLKDILLDFEKGIITCDKLLMLLYNQLVVNTQTIDLWNEFNLFLPQKYHEHWIHLLNSNKQ